MGSVHFAVGGKLTEWRTPMRQIVDRVMFDQVSATCYAVYEAVRFGELVADAASRIEAQADVLLRTAGNSYLTETLPTQALDDNTPMEQYSEAFVQIQHLRADLRSLLREVVHDLIKRGDTQAADRLAVKTLLSDAERCFKEGKWDEGRDTLRGFRMIPLVRLAYYRSFIDEMLAGSTTALQRLNGEIPGVVGWRNQYCFGVDGRRLIPRPDVIIPLWPEVERYLRANPQVGSE